MKEIFKNAIYKILVLTMMIITLSFFSVTPIVQASKMKLGKDEFYYSGTQESELIVKDSFLARIANALAEIIDYLLGIMTLGPRGIVVGLIEIMELVLTALLTNQNIINLIGKATIASVSEDKDYSDEVVTIEKILFNRIQILDANMFK